MWPQSTLDEVRVAQERAEAGDAAYTWQVEPQLTLYEEGTIQELDHVELVDRFLREVLGWEACPALSRRWASCARPRSMISAMRR